MHNCHYIRMYYAIHAARETRGTLWIGALTWLDMTRTFAARVFLDRLGSWDDGDATSIHVSCSSLVTNSWSIGKDLQDGCQLLLISSFPQAAYIIAAEFFAFCGAFDLKVWRPPHGASYSQARTGWPPEPDPSWSHEKNHQKWHASPGRTVGNPLCSVGAECALCELGWGFQLLGQPSTSHVLPGEVRCLGDLPTDVGS